MVKLNTTEIVVLIIVIVFIIAYAVAIFMMYDTGTFIFKDWEQVVPPYACQPLISIKPLTSEQMQTIQNVITDPPLKSQIGPVGTYP